MEYKKLIISSTLVLIILINLGLIFKLIGAYYFLSFCYKRILFANDRELLIKSLNEKVRKILYATEV